ncbi:thioredoxin fold domain-containing protein [Phaeocystidibacter marisrubri]|uniref:Thioredoxin fold domain-containing protein n=2 Tax=Phaeocystidibacter marisrubri TaxID=1577780 RepID=A0A6L3ZDT3_9FLAO|nr:thioredoxin fold domain-containing protein [Phaeocystidibacter marisrubri]
MCEQTVHLSTDGKQASGRENGWGFFVSVWMPDGSCPKINYLTEKFALMFKYLLTIVAMCGTMFVHANDTLDFFSGNYDQLLIEAESSQKPVLLYFHFNGCGGCTQMEKNVFVDPDVQRYYNQSFLVFEVNIKEEEGMKVNQNYNVQLAPTFIFLNPAGEQVHKIVGVFSIPDFVRAGKIAAQEEETLNALQQQYAAGNRDSDFLYRYCQVLRDANVMDSGVVSQYIQTLPEKELKSEQTLSFIYEYSFIHHDAVFSFYSPAIKALRANKPVVYEKYDSANVERRIMYIAMGDLGKAIRDKDREKYEELIQYLEKYLPTDVPFLVFPEVDGRFTMATQVEGLIDEFRLQALISFEGADAAYEHLITEVPNPRELDESRLISTAATIRYLTEDPKLLGLGLEWAEIAIELYPSYHSYSVYAHYLYTLGRYSEAKEATLKSIELGEADDYYCQMEEELLVRIEEKL